MFANTKAKILEYVNLLFLESIASAEDNAKKTKPTTCILQEILFQLILIIVIDDVIVGLVTRQWKCLFKNMFFCFVFGSTIHILFSYIWLFILDMFFLLHLFLFSV